MADIAAGRSAPTKPSAALREGIALEDELTYDEPTAWAVPLRQQLGAVLLAVGRPKEAERAFRQDLVRYPNNGWSLHGLALALAAREDGRGEARGRGVQEGVEPGGCEAAGGGVLAGGGVAESRRVTLSAAKGA